MNKKLLLISNTISQKGGLLNHCFDKIKKFVGNQTVLYIPFALKDWDRLEKTARAKFAEEGIKLISIHKQKNYKEAVEKAKVLFVGGGNTFRLLKILTDNNLLETIKNKVESGQLVYIGSSAGSNVACPTIMTTNDMPIVEINSFKALSLVPFQINPHYIDGKIGNRYMGETRETRINEFQEENNIPVIGLREESWLSLENNKLLLEGTTGAKLFIKNKKPLEIKSNTNLNFLL